MVWDVPSTKSRDPQLLAFGEAAVVLHGLRGGRREKLIGPVQAVVVDHGELHSSDRPAARNGGLFAVRRRGRTTGKGTSESIVLPRATFTSSSIARSIRRLLIESFLLKVRQDHGEHSRAVWPGAERLAGMALGVRPVRVTLQRGPNRESTVRLVKTVKRQPDLSQVIAAGNPSAGLTRGLHRRQQQARSGCR